MLLKTEGVSEAVNFLNDVQGYVNLAKARVEVLSLDAEYRVGSVSDIEEEGEPRFKFVLDGAEVGVGVEGGEVVVEGGWGDGAEEAVWNLRRVKVAKVLEALKVLQWEEGGISVEEEDWRVVWKGGKGGAGRVVRWGEGRKVWSEDKSMVKVVNTLNEWLLSGDDDGGGRKGEIKRAIEERIKEVSVEPKAENAEKREGGAKKRKRR